MFSNGRRMNFEGEVVSELKEKLEVGCGEKVHFKYIGVGIRQERDKVAMS